MIFFNILVNCGVPYIPRLIYWNYSEKSIIWFHKNASAQPLTQWETNKLSTWINHWTTTTSVSSQKLWVDSDKPGNQRKQTVSKQTTKHNKTRSSLPKLKHQELHIFAEQNKVQYLLEETNMILILSWKQQHVQEHLAANFLSFLLWVSPLYNDCIFSLMVAYILFNPLFLSNSFYFNIIQNRREKNLIQHCPETDWLWWPFITSLIRLPSSSTWWRLGISGKRTRSSGKRGGEIEHHALSPAACPRCATDCISNKAGKAAGWRERKAVARGDRANRARSNLVTQITGRAARQWVR